MTVISACGSEGVGNVDNVDSSTDTAINSPDSAATDNAPVLGAAQAAETSQSPTLEANSPENQTSETGTGDSQSTEAETTDMQVTESGIGETPVNEVETTETETTEASTDETQSAETDTTVSTDNLTPVITDSSYNCDLVVDAIGYKVGDTDNFTLTVDDESPFTLSYAVDSSNSDVVDITVDENGIFTISAMAAGETYLWLTAEDEHGLVDEYEIWVVVD